MDLKTRQYFDDCMCRYADVYDLEVRLLIVSSGKSTLAYETCVMLAERSNLQVELGMLRCEDGKMHEHAFISGRRPGRDENIARTALNLVFQHKESEDFTRPNFQYMMGLLLDYPVNEILDFVASPLARNCPCDCCGGPFVPEHMFD